MRLFPADIRSVVLDSAVPTQINVFNTESSVTQHAFDVLFHGCAASLLCNFSYPRLDSLFYQLVTVFNNNPVTFRDPLHRTVQGISEYQKIIVQNRDKLLEKTCYPLISKITQRRSGAGT